MYVAWLSTKELLPFDHLLSFDSVLPTRPRLPNSQTVTLLRDQFSLPTCNQDDLESASPGMEIGLAKKIGNSDR